MAIRRLLQLTAVADTTAVACCSACRTPLFPAKLSGCDSVSEAAEKLCSSSWLSTPYTSSDPSDVTTSNLMAGRSAEASATSTRLKWWAAGTDAGSWWRLMVGAAPLRDPAANTSPPGTGCTDSGGTSSRSRVCVAVEYATKRPSAVAPMAMTWPPAPVEIWAMCSGSALCPERPASCNNHALGP